MKNCWCNEVDQSRDNSTIVEREKVTHLHGKEQGIVGVVGDEEIESKGDKWVI